VFCIASSICSSVKSSLTLSCLAIISCCVGVGDGSGVGVFVDVGEGFGVGVGDKVGVDDAVGDEVGVAVGLVWATATGDVCGVTSLEDEDAGVAATEEGGLPALQALKANARKITATTPMVKTPLPVRTGCEKLTVCGLGKFMRFLLR